jgi:hypothetical protein
LFPSSEAGLGCILGDRPPKAKSCDRLPRTNGGGAARAFVASPDKFLAQDHRFLAEDNRFCALTSAISVTEESDGSLFDETLVLGRSAAAGDNRKPKAKRGQ